MIRSDGFGSGIAFGSWLPERRPERKLERRDERVLTLLAVVTEDDKCEEGVRCEDGEVRVSESEEVFPEDATLSEGRGGALVGTAMFETSLTERPCERERSLLTRFNLDRVAAGRAPC